LALISWLTVPLKGTEEYVLDATENVTVSSEKHPTTDVTDVELNRPTAFTYNIPPAAFATGELNSGADTDTKERTLELKLMFRAHVFKSDAPVQTDTTTVTVSPT